MLTHHDLVLSTGAVLLLGHEGRDIAELIRGDLSAEAVVLEVDIAVRAVDGQTGNRMERGLHLKTLDRGIAGIGDLTAGRTRAQLQTQLQVLILRVEHGRIQAQLAIEEVGLGTDLTRTQLLRIERLSLRRHKRTRADTAALEAGRVLGVGHDLIAPAVLSRHTIVDIAAVIVAAQAIEHTQERMHRTVTRKAREGVVLVLFGVTHASGQRQSVGDAVTQMSEHRLGVGIGHVVLLELQRIVAGVTQVLPGLIARTLILIKAAEGVIQLAIDQGAVEAQLFGKRMERQRAITQLHRHGRLVVVIGKAAVVLAIGGDRLEAGRVTELPVSRQRSAATIKVHARIGGRSHQRIVNQLRAVVLRRIGTANRHPTVESACSAAETGVGAIRAHAGDEGRALHVVGGVGVIGRLDIGNVGRRQRAVVEQHHTGRVAMIGGVVRCQVELKIVVGDPPQLGTHCGEVNVAVMGHNATG